MFTKLCTFLLIHFYYHGSIDIHKSSLKMHNVKSNAGIFNTH